MLQKPLFTYPFFRVHLDATTASLPLSEHSIYLLLIRKSKFVVGAVEPRTIRVVLRGAGDSTDLPFIRWISRRAASRPFSTIGWCTVVSGGLVHADAGTSSNPTTERSSGTRCPLAWAAVTTPIAAISLMASTPVGRRLPLGSDSKALAPAATEMPAMTECGAGTPASVIAAR